MKIWNARESGNEDIQLLPIIAVDHQPKVSVINTSSHTVKILSIFKVLLDGKWKKEDSDPKNFSISPISSRKMVPPWTASKRPMRVRSAAVKIHNFVGNTWLIAFLFFAFWIVTRWAGTHDCHFLLS
jgi:hypothetical protein